MENRLHGMTETTDRKERGSALDKALAVLEAVIAQPRPVGLPDLTAELGLPRQTVHRVVQQLEGNGLLQRDPARDRYAVGPRLTRLALGAINASHQNGPMRAVLQDLVAEIGETCNVGMLDGHQVLYIDRVECDWPLRVQLQAGSHVPAHCTAIGKLLLAHLPVRARRRILEVAPLARFTEQTVTNPQAFEGALAEIRAQGYSANNQEYNLGMIALAVPVRDADGRVVAALAVHAPAARLSLDGALAHLPALEAAAARLAQAWGLDSEAPGGTASDAA